MNTKPISNNGKVTVLFLDHTAKLGGGEIALLNLLRHLDTRRFQPVVVLGEEGPLAVKLRESEIETHILPLATVVANTRKDSLGLNSLLRFFAMGTIFAYCWRLSRFIHGRGVKLVHTNSLKADLLGGAGALLAGVPSVWHVRDRIDSDYLPAPVAWLFRLLGRIVPDIVVADSAATLKSMRLPVSPHYAIVHEGVVTRDATVKSDPYSTRVGLVGRLSRWKGQHIFLQAAARVRSRFPSAKFQIIGSAMFGEEAYEREIRALAVSLGIDDCVEFMGFRNDVPQLMDELDVLVHASTMGEPFGQVITEGMVAAKPVVATRGGGVPEIVKDGITGLLVPMGDAAAMAESICTLLSDPARAREMGEAGRERALRHFTVKLTAQRLEAVFEKVVL